jgi:hypothetical protein
VGTIWLKLVIICERMRRIGAYWKGQNNIFQRENLLAWLAAGTLPITATTLLAPPTAPTLQQNELNIQLCLYSFREKTVPTVSVAPVQYKTAHFTFDKSDVTGIRTQDQTVSFRHPVSHAIAVVQGYDGTYQTGTYQEIAKVHFKVAATTDGNDDRSVKVTCEWQFGPEVPGYPSKGDVWVAVLGFTADFAVD